MECALRLMQQMVDVPADEIHEDAVEAGVVRDEDDLLVIEWMNQGRLCRLRFTDESNLAAWMVSAVQAASYTEPALYRALADGLSRLLVGYSDEREIDDDEDSAEPG